MRFFKIIETPNGYQIREKDQFGYFLLIYGWTNTLQQANDVIKTYVCQTQTQGINYKVL